MLGGTSTGPFKADRAGRSAPLCFVAFNVPVAISFRAAVAFCRTNDAIDACWFWFAKRAVKTCAALHFAVAIRALGTERSRTVNKRNAGPFRV